jgi:hypothetical protein
MRNDSYKELGKYVVVVGLIWLSTIVGSIGLTSQLVESKTTRQVCEATASAYDLRVDRIHAGACDFTDPWTREAQ